MILHLRERETLSRLCESIRAAASEVRVRSGSLSSEATEKKRTRTFSTASFISVSIRRRSDLLERKLENTHHPLNHYHRQLQTKQLNQQEMMGHKHFQDERH